MNHLTGIFITAWDTLTMASPYILLGLFVAALMRAFVKPSLLARHLGGNDFKSVAWAALSGVPLPLCSCGVVPTAMALRQQGASKPATVAFLISTPETGIDSIAVTYALLGPAMAVIRPITAFITAFVAGIMQIAFGGENSLPFVKTLPPPAPPYPLRGPWVGGELVIRLRMGLRYAFVDLLRDISGWLLIGILLGGVISYTLPETFIQNYLGTGWQAMLVMLVIGIPLYICASASTPIAAALMLKGMSPGAALVFLLAGPATNTASLPVLIKFLGKRAVVLYLIAIAVCTLSFGMLVNYFADALGISAATVMLHAHHPMPELFRIGFTVFLLGLIAYNYLLRRV